MIGSIALNEIKSYLNIEKIDSEIKDEILTWYIRHDKLFIKATDQSIKIQIFKEKINIIKKINSKLSAIWYNTEINDIILK
jgi:hypothetical protein